MRAVRFLGHSKVEVVDAAKPERDEQSVIIKVMASGICGSELHAFKGDPPKQEGFLNPGHELAGIIEEAPEGCGFAPGQRVGARVVQGCGHCEFCDEGYETACRNRKTYGGGGHAEYFQLGLGGIHPVPDGVDWPTAVVLTGDGLGVPVRAARRLGDTGGQKVLVLGLGPVGLSTVLVQAAGGAEVMGADLFDFRIGLALEVGAVAGVNIQTQNLKEKVMDWTGGKGADVVILAVGRADALLNAFDLVRQQGTVFQNGEFNEATINPSAAFIRKEITMTGSWYYTSSDWPNMLAVYESGAPVHKLITHVFSVEEAQRAYDQFVSGESGKVVLTYTH